MICRDCGQRIVLDVRRGFQRVRTANMIKRGFCWDCIEKPKNRVINTPVKWLIELNLVNYNKDLKEIIRDLQKKIDQE